MLLTSPPKLEPYNYKHVYRRNKWKPFVLGKVRKLGQWINLHDRLTKWKIKTVSVLSFRSFSLLVVMVLSFFFFIMIEVSTIYSCQSFFSWLLFHEYMWPIRFDLYRHSPTSRSVESHHFIFLNNLLTLAQFLSIPKDSLTLQVSVNNAWSEFLNLPWEDTESYFWMFRTIHSSGTEKLRKPVSRTSLPLAFFLVQAHDNIRWILLFHATVHLLTLHFTSLPDYSQSSIRTLFALKVHVKQSQKMTINTWLLYWKWKTQKCKNCFKMPR